MRKRILIVGFGSIGQKHLRIIRQSLPSAEIAILRHQAPKEVPVLANHCFGNLEDACMFRPELTVIANPAPFHVETIIGLANTDCHFLVEKPISDHMSSDLAEVKAMIGPDRIILVGYNLRYLPSLIDFRDRIHQGKIGRILSVRCEIGQYLPSWRPGSDYRNGVSARKSLGGGVLLELSHELDYLQWIFGKVRWVNAITARQSDLEIDVEDTAQIIMGHEDLLDKQEAITSLSMDFIRHDTIRICTAIGDKGSLRWDGLTGIVHFISHPDKHWQIASQHPHLPDDSYIAQWNHFVCCTELKETPVNDVENSIEIMKLIEAIRHSSDAQGKRISLTNLDN
jgi:predicted dehydrogenase